MSEATHKTSNEQMQNHQEAYELALIRAGNSNMARCFLEQREWMQGWHRLCESIATMLNVNSAGGLEELSIEISDAIQRIQRESAESRELIAHAIGGSHETRDYVEPEAIELLITARACLPDPDFVPTEEEEIRLRSIRDRIDKYMAARSTTSTESRVTRQAGSEHSPAKGSRQESTGDAGKAERGSPLRPGDSGEKASVAPAEYRQVGMKEKGILGDRTEFAWWDDIPEGAALYIRLAPSEKASAGMTCPFELGKAAYIATTANHPTIHCNRFPAWEELSEQERDEWSKRALQENGSSPQHKAGCWKLQSPSGQGVCNCGAE